MKYLTHGKFLATKSGTVKTQTMKPGTLVSIAVIILSSACNNQSSSTSNTDSTGTSVDFHNERDCKGFFP